MCVRALASLVIHLLTPFFICLSFFFFTEVPLFFFLLNHFLKYIRTQANITCFCLLVCFPLFWYPLLCTLLSNSTYTPLKFIFSLYLYIVFFFFFFCASLVVVVNTSLFLLCFIYCFFFPTLCSRFFRLREGDLAALSAWPNS